MFGRGTKNPSINIGGYTRAPHFKRSSENTNKYTKKKYKDYYDHKARDLTELQQGNKIRVQMNPSTPGEPIWKTGKVIWYKEKITSYLVET